MQVTLTSMCDGARKDSESLLAGLRQTVEAFRARQMRPDDGPTLTAELAELRHIIDLAELEFASLAHLLDATGHWEAEGAVTPQDFIRHTCKMSAGASRAAVVVGDRMPALAESVAAVGAGRIGFAHLALMAGTADWVTRQPSGDAPFDEQLLLPQAESHSVSRFRYDCDHARHAADREGALRAHVEAVERRWLEFEPSGDGMVLVHGQLDEVGAATVRTAVEPLARRTGSDDRRSRSRRLADAWVELASHRLDDGSLPRRGSQRPHLQVTTTLETLRGLDGAPAAELELGGTVTTATVQRLACDAAVVRILLDSESALVDVGRARRTAPPATIRALRARDEGCVWPGCGRPPTWTTAHHVLEWAAHRGGTNTSTMVLLCYGHHWRVHEGGWQIARTDEGVITVPPQRGFVSPQEAAAMSRAHELSRQRVQRSPASDDATSPTADPPGPSHAAARRHP